MIGYVNIGTNDFAKATSFYDDLLGTIGAVRVFEVESFIAWSTGASAPALSISRPFDGGEATVGNGVMVAIGVDTPEKVDAFHAKAIELGASNEGAPGIRTDNFYAGYFRDLDGNKLNAFCFTRD